MHVPQGFVSQIISQICSGNDYSLETRSGVKVNVAEKWNASICHPNMHPHTKCGIPTSTNIGDVLQTRCRF